MSIQQTRRSLKYCRRPNGSPALISFDGFASYMKLKYLNMFYKALPIFQLRLLLRYLDLYRQPHWLPFEPLNWSISCMPQGLSTGCVLCLQPSPSNGSSWLQSFCKAQHIITISLWALSPSSSNPNGAFPWSFLIASYSYFPSVSNFIYFGSQRLYV